QAHAFGAGIGLQAGSLTEQQELSKSNLVHVAGQISPRPVQRGRRSADEILRPLEITGAVVSGLESAEERVVVEPVGLVPPKVFEGRAQIRAPAGAEVLPRRLEQGVLEALDGVVVDGRGRKRTVR